MFNQNAALNINLAGVDDSDTIPEADYPLMLTEVEAKENSTQTGAYISATFKVSDGPRKGFTIFENYNYQHPNHQAVQIGLKNIKRYLKAVGYTGDEQLTMALLESCKGREFLGSVYIEKGTGGYQDKNRIGKYHELENNLNTPIAPQAVAPATEAPQEQVQPSPAGQPTPGAKGRPWERQQ